MIGFLVPKPWKRHIQNRRSFGADALKPAAPARHKRCAARLAIGSPVHVSAISNPALNAITTTYRRSTTQTMAGISVGGRFLKFECHEINLKGLNLSESELLHLLECITRGDFTNLRTLMMVIAAKWVLQLFFDVFDAGWKWDRGQRREDDRRGAEH